MTEKEIIYYCPICGGNETEIAGPYRNLHAAFDGLHRAYCRSCEMMFSAPMPSDKSMEEFNATYFDSAHGGLVRSAPAIAFFNAVGKIRGMHLEKFLSIKNLTATSILEIGPGHGFFADNWIRRNPGTSYFGLETDKSCYSSLKSCGVELIDTSSKMPSTDVVIISHVLEHVTDPVFFLTNVTEGLKTGGILFIEVPCMDWKYKPLDEPHLLFFDKHPMKILLKRLGFSNIEVSYHGQEIEVMKNESFLKKKLKGIKFKLLERGIVKPFALATKGLDFLNDSLERAAVAPYKAHLESQNPSWWLRAVAIKDPKK
jgi:predicted SAM-dependent methyltransferase